MTPSALKAGGRTRVHSRESIIAAIQRWNEPFGEPPIIVLRILSCGPVLIPPVNGPRT